MKGRNTTYPTTPSSTTQDTPHLEPCASTVEHRYRCDSRGYLECVNISTCETNMYKTTVLYRCHLITTFALVRCVDVNFESDVSMVLRNTQHQMFFSGDWVVQRRMFVDNPCYGFTAGVCPVGRLCAARSKQLTEFMS